MKVFLVLVAILVSCHAALFNNPSLSGNGCSYPNWKCNCRLVYRCDGTTGFPDDLTNPADAKEIKDLAPDDYSLRIPGKRWRREIWSQEEFCKQECNDRLNAFLCLNTDGTPTDYSHSALCIKMLETAGEPFTQDSENAAAEPCCEVYLQWGLDWCPDKWNRLVTTLRCFADTIHMTFDDNVRTAFIHHVFSVDAVCDVGAGDVFNWCVSAPMCPAV